MQKDKKWNYKTRGSREPGIAHLVKTWQGKPLETLSLTNVKDSYFLVTLDTIQSLMKNHPRMIHTLQKIQFVS